MLARVAEVLRSCTKLVIAAGAGMGVDGGLPSFRGLGSQHWDLIDRLGLPYEELASPARFAQKDFIGPRTAWAFWKLQMDLYHGTPLHEGYRVLERWMAAKGPGNSFVYTSNIDGHFRRLSTTAQGLVECHGGVDFLQCTEPDECPGEGAVWPTDYAAMAKLTVDHKMRLNKVPRCPHCGRTARPAVLMFADSRWSTAEANKQFQALEAFERRFSPSDRVAVIEIGAGITIPTVRNWAQMFCYEHRATLIRINPEYPEVTHKAFPSVSVQATGLETLRALDGMV